jgi:hypothetical protein
VAVLLSGKFIFLAHPHTGSSAMMLALQDAFPDAYDLRPHHMSLEDLKGPQGAFRMEQIGRQRGRLWARHKDVRHPDGVDPSVVQRLVKGTEHVFGVVRDPYDFLVSCFVRRGRGQPFEGFVRGYNESPYIEDGRIYYHADDCDTLLRHENLQPELDALMEKLGLPPVPLQRHNETKGKQPWQSYYTPEAYRVVNERFGDEFSRFYEPRSS